MGKNTPTSLRSVLREARSPELRISDRERGEGEVYPPGRTNIPWSSLSEQASWLPPRLYMPLAGASRAAATVVDESTEETNFGVFAKQLLHDSADPISALQWRSKLPFGIGAVLAACINRGPH